MSDDDGDGAGDSVSEGDLFGSSDDEADGPDGPDAPPRYYGGAVVNQAELDAFGDWLDDLEHTYVHVLKAPPLEAATKRRDAILHHVARHRDRATPNDVAMLIASPIVSNMLESRTAAQNDDAAFESVVLVERGLVKALREELPDDHPLRYPVPVRKGKDDAPYRGALADEGMLAWLKQRVNDYWRARQTLAGFTLAEFWAEVSASLNSARSFEPQVNADHYASYITELMNSPAPVLDTDYRPPPAGAPFDTIARELDIAWEDTGLFDSDAYVSRTKVQGGDYRPLLEGEVLREGIEREKLYGCRSKDDLLEFGIVPKVGSAGSQTRILYGRAPRAPDGAPLRVRVEFEDLDEPAEARVLYIHPVIGMRVEYLDEDRTRGFVHNGDTWEWVGLGLGSGSV